MRPPGRVQAAIEVLAQVMERHRPASVALADWGRAHRFAGAGDRAAIGNLVYDALRRKSSAAALMGEETPRAVMLGMFALKTTAGAQNGGADEPLQGLAALFDGSQHGPPELTNDEVAALTRGLPTGTQPWVQADVPEWLWTHFTDQFDEEAIDEARALAERAPVDLRTNTLKTTRAKVRKALERFGATDSPLAPHGLRIPPPEGIGGRTPNVQADGTFQRGHFEVQDEGSQLVSALVAARPGEQVLDYCAGAGGKSLALAAIMENKGQIFAHDIDATRLAPIYDRIKRAGARNVQVRGPGDPPLDDLIGRMHRVVVDAPCTGSGVWRRRPDAKWRLTPDALGKRCDEQRDILSKARDYVRPGGYLCYITCSILAEENEAQVYAFLDDNPDFELISAEEVWRELVGMESTAMPWSTDTMTLTLTPASTGTDGFFFAIMERRGGM